MDCYCLDNEKMSYPRVCAHRGFNTVAPENSMPAFGAAVALGAKEIEFDLWYTKDGELVSIHDAKLDRVSDGTGFVYDYTYEELLKFDFGVKHNKRSKKKHPLIKRPVKYDEHFKGLRILTFEDILKKFAKHVIMNIHIKTIDNDCAYDEELMHKIIALIDKYDCRKYVYFMTGNDTLLQQLGAAAPDICRCCGGGKAKWEIVERAIKYGCQKVQMFKPAVTKEMIDKAHAHGILCNVFWADDPQEACDFLDMGIDTILTNDYLNIALAVEKHTKD